MSAFHPLALDQPASYRIVVQGHVGEEFATWMGEVSIAAIEGENAVTVLVARVADQAELYGILQTLYSLGLILLSLRREA
jgi:hypothetical protein